jgi:hypothetical protein
LEQKELLSAKSGVGYEGTGLRIARANAEQAEITKKYYDL